MVSGVLDGLEYTCSSCKGLKPTFKNMTQKLDEICTRTENADMKFSQMEKKIIEAVDSIDEKIASRFNEELPKLTNEMDKMIDSKVLKIEKDLNAKIDDIKVNIGNVESHDSAMNIEDVARKVIKEEMSKATPLMLPKKKDELSPTSLVKKLVTDFKEEMAEKDSRKNNMLLFKLDEELIDTNTKEARVENDKAKMIDICHNTLGIRILKKEDLIKCDCIGETKDTARPLKIVLSSQDLKDKIWARLWKLKNSKYSHVSFNHDLTKTEREELEGSIS